MKKKLLVGIVTIIGISYMMMLFSPQLHAGVIYNINFDGLTIDLTGSIETDIIGTFEATVFDKQVIDYSITASLNGAYPFTFNLTNSTWGVPYGYVDIIVSASLIQLSAPSGGIGLGFNVFLLADNVTNGAKENLRFFQDQLGFRTPNPPDDFYVETVSTPFILASAQPVPEPATMLLLGSGLIGLAGYGRKKFFKK